MSNRNFLSRMLPLIDRAAEAARDKSKRVIVDGHILWQVYLQERSRLLSEAADVKNGERMSPEDFEAYLIRLTGESESTVWAWDTDEDSDDRSI